MIIGILSATHKDGANALPHILREFKKREAELVIHCGDIEDKHLASFDGFPVVCALNAEQLEAPQFKIEPPPGWVFTKPNDRIRTLSGIKMYIGHKMSFQFLTGAESIFAHFIEEIRDKNDGLRWIFSGHTHHQIFLQTRLVNFINPGAVENSFDGYEFAIANTDNYEIVFCRVPKTKPVIDTFSVGVISDSLNISKEDPGFWDKLVKEFQKRGVKHVIHCGNIALEDIGREEFEHLKVYCNLRFDQQRPQSVPENWDLLSLEKPVAVINGYKFYVQLDLGAALIDKSEFDMHKLSLELRRKHPEISFILCGMTNNAFLEEGEQVRIINPGDVLKDRNFAVICLPRTEITFGHVPVDPLPPVEIQ